MAIVISEKSVTLAVRDLITLNPKTSRTLASFPLPQRGMLGKNAQLKVQSRARQKFGLFHREYPVNASLSWNGYQFTIQGRIDGLYELKNRVEVEEIKSVILTSAEFNQLHIEKYPEYSEQLLFYCYLLFLQDNTREISPFLTLINLINDKERVFRIDFSPLAVESLLFSRLAMIVEQIALDEKIRRNKARDIKKIRFHLPENRPQQQEMMNRISDSVSAGQHLLISAPTGTGKTAGTPSNRLCGKPSIPSEEAIRT